MAYDFTNPIYILLMILLFGVPIVTTAHTIGVSSRATMPATAVTGIRRPRRRSVSTSPAVTAATAHCSAAAA